MLRIGIGFLLLAGLCARAAQTIENDRYTVSCEKNAQRETV